VSVFVCVSVRLPLISAAKAVSSAPQFVGVLGVAYLANISFVQWTTNFRCRRCSCPKNIHNNNNNNSNTNKNNKIQLQQFCYYFYNPFFILIRALLNLLSFFRSPSYADIHIYRNKRRNWRIILVLWSISNLRRTELNVLINYNF